MKKRKSKRIAAGAIWLFLVGVAFILYPTVSQIAYNKRSSGEIDEFTASYVTEASDVDLTKTVYPELYQALVDYNVELYKDRQSCLGPDTYEEFPVDISEYGLANDVIGFINIPNINIQLPLYLGADEQHLIDGAAVMGNTSAPVGGVSTNAVIAGHNYCYGTKRFVYLANLEKGDPVIITTFWGSRTYRVESTLKVKEDNYGSIKIQEGKDMITLMTCYKQDGVKLRYLVFCVYDPEA